MFACQQYWRLVPSEKRDVLVVVILIYQQALVSSTPLVIGYEMAASGVGDVLNKEVLRIVIIAVLGLL